LLGTQAHIQVVLDCAAGYQIGHRTCGGLAGFPDVDTRDAGRGGNEQVRSEDNRNKWKGHAWRSYAGRQDEK
jgi:hypothetical protein